ncbi:type VII secretion protein EccE [Mycolicibacterium sarraceniae]|uniref:ESX-3 secretion system protein EccE3 n=1 Tax=Mycolicibacterium sarraceniae TaxID=1534348 RepID=A0A7I7SPA9_9MYCO|nr:type VII secretion protein EccE [Mycolicibacterium sarraceniae]BBY58844.1 ESX-3 secretion system protein EccE3 [Mycolicibacterium sarraceniae]
MSGIPSPGAGRLTVVLLAVVAAVLAYPWRTPNHQWALGIAIAVVLVSLLWWRGRYLTTIAGQRLRVLLRRRPIEASPAELHRAGVDAVATVLVRVDGDDRQPPLGLLSGYLDRYGLRADSVRVTTRSTADDATTWVGLTFSGARNLSALQARSAQIPLREAAENAARRLIGQLREIGWTATIADPDQVPDLVAADAREQWQSVTDARGYLTTYAAQNPEALAAVSLATAAEAWTVVEIAGTSRLDRVRAGAAIRTEGKPSTPTAGLVSIPGRQASALAALHPLSGARLVN